mmetsp:Transcript_50595/g.97876  ORF Transcript_50595/g.97876 Transcript_50595/m.97876 type:complete len:271 (-) Transcript_50595:53-865(-)
MQAAATMAVAIMEAGTMAVEIMAVGTTAAVALHTCRRVAMVAFPPLGLPPPEPRLLGWEQALQPEQEPPEEHHSGGSSLRCSSSSSSSNCRYNSCSNSLSLALPRRQLLVAVAYRQRRLSVGLPLHQLTPLPCLLARCRSQWQQPLEHSHVVVDTLGHPGRRRHEIRCLPGAQRRRQANWQWNQLHAASQAAASTAHRSQSPGSWSTAVPQVFKVRSIFHRAGLHLPRLCAVLRRPWARLRGSPQQQCQHHPERGGNSSSDAGERATGVG